MKKSSSLPISQKCPAHIKFVKDRPGLDGRDVADTQASNCNVLKSGALKVFVAERAPAYLALAVHKTRYIIG